LWYGQNRNIDEDDEEWKVRVKKEVKATIGAFTEDDFWFHFKECENARKRWETRYWRIPRISGEEDGVLAVDD
jgi:transcription initiation factor IIE alpha subunit